MFDPACNNRGAYNDYWYASPEGSTPRFYWGTSQGTWGVTKGGLIRLADFNATSGEEQGRYLTDAEKNQIATSKGIPQAPENH